MMNIIKNKWTAIYTINGIFIVVISLWLCQTPYQVNATHSAISAVWQQGTPLRIQQPVRLVATATYTYYFPLVFQNYRAPTWELLGLSGNEVRDIATDPNLPSVLYATTTVTQGVFKSADFGESWYQTNNGLREDGALAQVAVDPSDSSKVYLIRSSYPRFYYSENGGQSWQPGGDIPLTPKILSVHSTVTKRLFAGVGAWDGFGGGGWLCKSNDGGLNWTVVITRQVLANSIATSALAPSLVYVGGNGLYRSQDGGDTFVSVLSDLPFYAVEAVAIHPTNPLTTYISTKVDIFKSTDGGDSWLWWGVRPANQTHRLLINYHRPETQYIASRNCEGVFVSDDEGRHWQSINTNLGNLCINDLEANIAFTKIYAATNNGLWVLDLTDGVPQ